MAANWGVPSCLVETGKVFANLGKGKSGDLGISQIVAWLDRHT